MFKKVNKSVVFLITLVFNVDNVMRRQRTKSACVIGQVMIYNTIEYDYSSQSTVQIRHSREPESSQSL